MTLEIKKTRPSRGVTAKRLAKHKSNIILVKLSDRIGAIYGIR